MPESGKQLVLSDVVIEDGVDLGAAGLGKSLDRRERFDRETLGLAEARGRQLVGLAGMSGGFAAYPEAGAAGNDRRAGARDIEGNLVEDTLFLELDESELGSFLPCRRLIAEAESVEFPVDERGHFVAGITLVGPGAASASFGRKG